MKKIFLLAFILVTVSIEFSIAMVKVWPGKYIGSGSGYITCSTKGSLCCIVVTPNNAEINVIGNTTTCTSDRKDIKIQVPDANLEINCQQVSTTVQAEVTSVSYE